MNCEDAIQLLCWYLEGKLSADAAQGVEDHVYQCEECHMVLASARRTFDEYFHSVEVADGQPNMSVV